MPEVEEQRQQRLAKIERLREQGIEPYPQRYERTHLAAEAKARFEPLSGQELRLAGRILTVRRMGKVTFAHIADGSGKIQIYLRQDVLGIEKYADFKNLDIGDYIGVKGTLFRTRTGETTLEVTDLVLLCKSLRPLPDKWHGLTDVEKRYRQRYLDLLTNEETQRTFVLRSAIIRAIRRFLDERGFIEVETPILQPLYGGASARPFETYHNALDQRLYLRIASELYLKRLIVGGMDRVYEIGKNFRNEGISIKHNPEYTCLECYQAYADYHDIMSLVEEMIKSIAQETLGTVKISYQGHRIDLTPPWRRMTLREAILQYSGIDVDLYPDRDSLLPKVQELGLQSVPGTPRGKLIDQLFSSFVEPQLIQPTFLLDYPVDISPLAKRKTGHPDLVERFEGVVGGLEIANAFTELNDPLDQRERFTQQAEDRAAGDEEAHVMDEDFLLALEFGMPPTGGLGIGIDRLVMLLTDQPSIREVILFPHLRTKD